MDGHCQRCWVCHTAASTVVAAVTRPQRGVRVGKGVGAQGLMVMLVLAMLHVLASVLGGRCVRLGQRHGLGLTHPMPSGLRW